MTGGMMFKGTPFPWRYEEYEDAASYKSVRVMGSNGQTVCDSESYYPAPVEPEDAKLIAAAPDLLEALQMFLTEYVDLVESGDAAFWDPEKENKVIKARAAIAKALGETK